MFDLQSRELFVSRLVTFYEHSFPFQLNATLNTDSSPPLTTNLNTYDPWFNTALPPITNIIPNNTTNPTAQASNSPAPDPTPSTPTQPDSPQELEDHPLTYKTIVALSPLPPHHKSNPNILLIMSSHTINFPLTIAISHSPYLPLMNQLIMKKLSSMNAGEKPLIKNCMLLIKTRLGLLLLSLRVRELLAISGFSKSNIELIELLSIIKRVWLQRVSPKKLALIT